MDSNEGLADLKEVVREFSEKRDWDQYHNAKDLAIGIITEASELLEHFRFKSEEEIDEIFSNNDSKEEVTEELADVLFFVLRFAQIYDIDMVKGFKNKMKKNQAKYPVSEAKGSNEKYTELGLDK